MIDISEYQDNLFSQITQFYMTDMCLLLCVLQVSCNILIFAKISVLQMVILSYNQACCL